MNDYKKAWEDILQRSDFAWWEWDISTNTVRFNDLKASMLGFDPEDFYSGGYRAFTDLVHPDDHEKTMEAMRLVLSGKTNLYQIDYRIRTAAGNYVWFMDRGIIIKKDDHGQPLKIRGVVVDLGRESQRGTDIDALMSVFYRSGTSAEGKVSFITVCSVCKKIKKKDTDWVDLPSDLSALIGERISHGICPACVKKLYPDLAEQVLGRIKENQ
ncbi:MAG: PAS domain-containing protein [FCB group bacterium]|nr:PAS domain-containing protein [FCB group bacterium]